MMRGGEVNLIKNGAAFGSMAKNIRGLLRSRPHLWYYYSMYIVTKEESLP